MNNGSFYHWLHDTFVRDTIKTSINAEHLHMNFRYYCQFLWVISRNLLFLINFFFGLFDYAMHHHALIFMCAMISKYYHLHCMLKTMKLNYYVAWMWEQCLKKSFFIACCRKNMKIFFLHFVAQRKDEAKHKEVWKKIVQNFYFQIIDRNDKIFVYINNQHTNTVHMITMPHRDML